ncbi:SPFH domain-containing protein [Streptomyces sp. NRRL F-4489]|uniref:SPFH domain-containing protein n=1 Tax=Streptomyces sp. NRRL F-4489 TaxID=1609095 RepID=UPI0008368162
MAAGTRGEDGARRPDEACGAEDDTEELPSVVVSPPRPETGGPAPAPVPTEGPARPQDVAVAGIALVNDLLDTAERTAARGAPGPIAPPPAPVPAPPPVPAPARTAPPPTEPRPEPHPQPHRAEGRVPSRRIPSADPDLVERRGRSFSGWAAALLAVLALAGCAALLWWHALIPERAVRAAGLPLAPDHGPMRLWEWALVACGGVVALLALGGITRGRAGSAWVLSLFGRYRGSVRRTGLVWINPMVLRRRVDVRLRHWRSEPMPAVDAAGVQLRVVVLVVWRVKDTARALLAVNDHEAYLREQVEAAMARVLSQLPADAFHEDTPTLRDAEAVGDALTKTLSADCRPVGIEVFSAQPTRIEYAPEVAAAMRRSQLAALDAKHRDTVLTSVIDAVDETIHRLTSRGLVELDDYERRALVRDLTIAFYTSRGSAPAET